MTLGSNMSESTTLSILRLSSKITTKSLKFWKGNLYSGINFKWDYTNHMCRLSMKDYIDNLRVKFDHTFPSKP